MGNEKNKKRKKKRTGYIITNVVLAIATAVFIFALVKLVMMLVPYYKGETDYKKVRELAVVVPKEEGFEEEKFSVDFDALMEMNSDTIGWIRFEEPEIINYPIVKSQDNVEYLTRTFSANDNKLGSIFVDMNNSSDFSDKNTLIYGHNMAVGDQMFSKIRDYGHKDFMEAHPYFYIYTPDNVEHKYRVFASGIVKETADNYKISFGSDSEFESFLNLCKSSGLYDTDVELNEDSKIVTLSTCTCVNEDERFIVQAVLDEEEIKKDTK